jgi:MerR family transcriptional regulator, light-induced transcriptional regulator
MSTYASIDSRPASLHIQSVARLTNLSVDTIRAWEKRYSAVVPVRGPSGQRRFSSDDVARLVLLKEAVAGGQSISRIASLPTQHLRVLVQNGQNVGDADDAVISRILPSIYAIDVPLLTSELTKTGLSRTAAEFGDDIVAPLMVEISANAHSIGESTTCELVLCSAIRSISSLLLAKYAVDADRPMMLFLTLPGEKHVIPPLLASLAAAEAGYRALYVGTEVAPYHVESIVRATKAVAVGIYIGVHSNDAVQLLREVRNRIAPVHVFVGGESARYSTGLNASETLRSFMAQLAFFGQEQR